MDMVSYGYIPLYSFVHLHAALNMNANEISYDLPPNIYFFYLYFFDFYKHDGYTSTMVLFFYGKQSIRMLSVKNLELFQAYQFLLDERSSIGTCLYKYSMNDPQRIECY